jgi:hypothetical protein
MATTQLDVAADKEKYDVTVTDPGAAISLKARFIYDKALTRGEVLAALELFKQRITDSREFPTV